MYDIRQSSNYCQQFSPKHHVEDFRVHDDDLYVLTSQPNVEVNNFGNNEEAENNVPHTIGLHRFQHALEDGEALSMGYLSWH